MKPIAHQSTTRSGLQFYTLPEKVFLMIAALTSIAFTGTITTQVYFLFAAEDLDKATLTFDMTFYIIAFAMVIIGLGAIRRTAKALAIQRQLGEISSGQ